MTLLFGTLFVIALLFWASLWQLIEWVADKIISKFERN